jgi:N-formylmaleamate deformylase
MSDRVLAQPALADLAGLPATSRWVRNGDIRLHVLDYGGDGVPMVMLPGITSPAISMDFVARRLTDLVRPIVVDVRGRGLSDDGDSYALPDYASDTEAVVTGLALDQTILFGHSMGARIAAVAAASMATSALVLVDPPMSGPGRGPYPTPLDAFVSQLREARRGTDADEVARWWPTWPLRELQLRARWLASCGEKAVAETHRGFESEDFFDYWPTLDVPATLCYGKDSPVVTAEGAREAAETNPLARCVAIPAAGHMVFWDNLEGALAAVRAALRSANTLVEKR